MSAMTGTHEDAEVAWEAYKGEHLFSTDYMRPSFLAGFAARPSVTVDEITELLAGHQYATWGRCSCGLTDERWGDGDSQSRWHAPHVASVIVAHITGEGT